MRGAYRLADIDPGVLLQCDDALGLSHLQRFRPPVADEVSSYAVVLEVVAAVALQAEVAVLPVLNDVA